MPGNPHRLGPLGLRATVNISPKYIPSVNDITLPKYKPRTYHDRSTHAPSTLSTICDLIQFLVSLFAHIAFGVLTCTMLTGALWDYVNAVGWMVMILVLCRQFYQASDIRDSDEKRMRMADLNFRHMLAGMAWLGMRVLTVPTDA